MSQENSTKFFFKPAGSLYAYCSHCGQKIMQDHYNMNKHGKQCGFDSHDILKIIDKNFYGYDFQKENRSTLVFTVYRPVMHLRPGFSDSYYDGSWEIIHQTRFRLNSKKTQEEGQATFLEWLSRIDGDVHYIGQAPIQEIISSVFPVVPHIYNLISFYEIYRQKGYKAAYYKPSATVLSTYCKPRPNEITVGLCKRQSSNQVFVCGDFFTIKGKSLLAVRAYCYSSSIDTPDFYSFIIGEKIFSLSKYSSPKTDFCRKLLSPNVLCNIPDDVLFDFDAAYPSFGLKAYLKGNGQNILLPFLFSGNFHKGLELLIKSGNSWYADRYFKPFSFREFQLFSHEPAFDEYSNASQLLNLPKSLLGTPPCEQFSDQHIRDRISYLFHTNRKLIEGITFTPNVVKFVMEQDLTRDRSVYLSAVPGLNNLTDVQLRKILKYLEKLPESQYEYYRDYLQMMYQTQIFDFGYCPKNLREAHDDLMRSLMPKNERRKEEQFLAAVREYKSLETSPAINDSDTDPFAKSPFFIRCPHTTADLNQEGRAQHNCVATYRYWIMEKQCQILFMRRKEDPDASLVTIEVRGNRLLQVKAAFNKTASAECQLFVKKWCEYHKIIYRDCSDLTIPVTQENRPDLAV